MAHALPDHLFELFARPSCDWCGERIESSATVVFAFGHHYCSRGCAEEADTDMASCMTASRERFTKGGAR